MSWNWDPLCPNNPPNEWRYDELNNSINSLRDELARHDYLLANELQSDVFCEYDRTLLAAELYKERLIALTTSARSQIMVVQVGAALVRYAQANQIQNTAGPSRTRYNQNTMAYLNSSNNQTSWSGNNINNTYHNQHAPAKKNKKRKRKAPQTSPIPVKVSTGPNRTMNKGITSIKTNTSPVPSTSGTSKRNTLVKTSAQVTPTTVRIKTSGTPLKALATPAKTSLAQILTKQTLPTTATIKTATAHTKTTAARSQKSAKNSVSAATGTNNVATTADTQVKSTAPVKTTNAPTKKSMLPVKTATTATKTNIAASKTNTASSNVTTQLKTVPAPKSLIPVKKEVISTDDASSQNIPSLFSLNLSHIKLQFAQSDRITIQPNNNNLEPMAGFSGQTIKTEPNIEDDRMQDDLEDQL